MALRRRSLSPSSSASPTTSVTLVSQSPGAPLVSPPQVLLLLTSLLLGPPLHLIPPETPHVLMTHCLHSQLWSRAYSWGLCPAWSLTDWAQNAYPGQPRSVLGKAKDSWPFPAGCWVKSESYCQHGTKMRQQAGCREGGVEGCESRSREELHPVIWPEKPLGRLSLELGTREWAGSWQVQM